MSWHNIVREILKYLFISYHVGLLLHILQTKIYVVTDQIKIQSDYLNHDYTE